MIKRKEEEQVAREMKKMLPTSFVEDVRLRNRLDRLRRACREHLNSGHLNPVTDCDI